jgi:hypothetical protein
MDNATNEREMMLDGWVSLGVCDDEADATYIQRLLELEYRYTDFKRLGCTLWQHGTVGPIALGYMRGMVSGMEAILRHERSK